MTWLSLMLDTKLFGFRAGGYHFTNVVFHTANTVLLFGLLSRATGSELRSACVAALFRSPLARRVGRLDHGVQRRPQPVFWTALAVGLFALCGKCRYVCRTRCPLIAFVASLLSKQTLVTLPFLLLLLDYWPLGRMQ